MRPPDFIKHKGKGEKKLPSKMAMKNLDKTQRTLTDYAKATPMTDIEPTSLMTQMMMRK